MGGSLIPITEEVARTCNSHIIYSDLASGVMEETAIRTGQLLTNFSGKLLNRVIHICLDRGLPALSSLVVTASDGTRGSGFNEVLRASDKDIPATDLERERAAAVERLECYKVYCEDLPADAEPRLTRRYEARMNPSKKTAPRPIAVCPGYGLQLPATGICNDCG
ncbi:hypothetical protein SRABI26_00353 [Arthrobacter sp. Bi26]|nr:hypothetical protein SRABI26_00353 [Arthrobacter sp. Bi26]